jgi:hypothetical protein
VVLPTLTAADAPTLAADAVTVMVVHLAQDRLLAPPEPYRRRSDSGVDTVAPDVRFSVSLLVASRFADYQRTWAVLEGVLRCFQATPVRQRGSQGNATPTEVPLPAGIDRLQFELLALAPAEQNALWSGVGLPYHPSLVYRVGVLTFADDTPSPDVLVSSTALDLQLLERNP